MPLRPEGVYVPLVTPFDSQGQVDTDQLRAAVRAMITAGVHGIVAAGTTGEGYALGFDERRHVLNTIVAEVAGELPVLAGVGGMSTHEALDQALLAKRAGVTGLMLAAPSYCLPTQGELAQHVITVVQAIDLSTVLYDYPARTGVSFTHAVLESVATSRRSWALKKHQEISPAYSGYSRILVRTSPSCVVLMWIPSRSSTRGWAAGSAG